MSLNQFSLKWDDRYDTTGETLYNKQANNDDDAPSYIIFSIVDFYADDDEVDEKTLRLKSVGKRMSSRKAEWEDFIDHLDDTRPTLASVLWPISESAENDFHLLLVNYASEECSYEDQIVYDHAWRSLRGLFTKSVPVKVESKEDFNYEKICKQLDRPTNELSRTQTLNVTRASLQQEELKSH